MAKCTQTKLHNDVCLSCLQTQEANSMDSNDKNLPTVIISIFLLRIKQQVHTVKKIYTRKST